MCLPPATQHTAAAAAAAYRFCIHVSSQSVPRYHSAVGRPHSTFGHECHNQRACSTLSIKHTLSASTWASMSISYHQQGCTWSSAHAPYVGTLKKLVSKQMLTQSSFLYSYRDAFRWMVQVRGRTQHGSLLNLRRFQGVAMLLSVHVCFETQLLHSCGLHQCAHDVQVATGLAYLHACNPIVVHRDLKLENLLLKGKFAFMGQCWMGYSACSKQA